MSTPLGRIGASEFDTATAVRRDADGPFTMDVDAGWCVGPKPNGGYLLAAMGRAARDALAASGTDHPHPLAASAHYLRAPDVGAARITVDVLRSGRSASQVRATLSQADKPCVEATFTLGELDTEPAWWSVLPPVEVPAFEDCVRLPGKREGAPFEVPIMDRMEVRLDPAVLGFASGTPSGRADLRGWLAFADGRAMDPLGLLFALDGLPPATFELASTGWVPTLQLTAYLRARPAPGPLRVRQRAQVITSGRVDEVCEIWDATGALVGQATQLAGIRIPDGLDAPTPA